MQKKSKKIFGKITLNILEEVSRILEITVEGILNPYDLKRRVNHSEPLDSEKFFNRLRSIERSGYIKIEKNNHQISVSLTNKGQLKLLESDIGNIIDGRWRIISFDIPEKIKNKRDVFRRTIKKMGFKQVQKSLWISPYIKADKIQLLLDELKIGKHVAYFIVEKTDINEYLLKKFNLNK